MPEKPIAAELTTTSYAILGLLSLRPWSAYELAQQMQRSLRNFWPRAERQLYNEPKRLVRHGLATASQEAVGRRPRTVYQITPAGRRVLRRWLNAEAAPAALEAEELLRTFLSDQGTKEQLLATLRGMRDRALEERARGAQICADYLATGGPFPNRLHIIGLMVRFISGFGEHQLTWAEWAIEQVEAWESTTDPGAFDPSPIFIQVVELAAGGRRRAESHPRG